MFVCFLLHNDIVSISLFYNHKAIELLFYHHKATFLQTYSVFYIIKYILNIRKQAYKCSI